MAPQRVAAQLDLGPSGVWTLLVWAFLITAVGLGLFAAFARFSDRQRAAGFLESRPGIVRVSAPREGRVQRIAIEPGDAVRAGQVLVGVDPILPSVDGMSSAAAALERVRRTETLLEERRGRVERRAEIDALLLRERIDTVSERVTILDSSIELGEQTVAAADEALAGSRRMFSSGSVSRQALRDTEQQAREARISLQSLRLAANEARTLLEEVEAQLARTPLDAAIEVSAIDESRESLRQRRDEIEQERSFDVVAPIDGTVDAVLVAAGERVAPYTTLVSILPERSDLYASLNVPSRAIVFIEPGQRVRVAYDAFPEQRYGFAYATVTDVSETLLSPDEQGDRATVEPSYRVTADLDYPYVQVRDRRVPLRPGLALSADIVVDRRSLASWGWRSLRSFGQGL